MYPAAFPHDGQHLLSQALVGGTDLLLHLFMPTDVLNQTLSKQMGLSLSQLSPLHPPSQILIEPMDLLLDQFSPMALLSQTLPVPMDLLMNQFAILTLPRPRTEGPPRSLTAQWIRRSSLTHDAYDSMWPRRGASLHQRILPMDAVSPILLQIVTMEVVLLPTSLPITAFPRTSWPLWWRRRLSRRMRS